MTHVNQSVTDHIADIRAANEDVDESIVKLAFKLAGNHKDFDSFVWYEEPDDSESWCIVYTENRDSTLLTQSNAAVYDREMEPFMDSDDIFREDDSHWACGWIAGYAIRVFSHYWRITAAFQKYAEIHLQYEEYPVLDEDDYSRREMEATHENVKDAIRYVRGIDKNERCDNADPDTLAYKVEQWISDNERNPLFKDLPWYGYPLESKDDRGGYPDDEWIVAALFALGYGNTPDYDPDNEPGSPSGYPEDDCKHWDSIIEAQTPRQGILWESIPVNGDDSQDDDPDNGESEDEPKHRYHACWTPWTGDSGNPTMMPADDLEEARAILADELSDSIESFYWNNDEDDLYQIKVEFVEQFGIELDNFDPEQWFASHDSFDSFQNLGEMWIEECQYDDCEIGEDW